TLHVRRPQLDGTPRNDKGSARWTKGSQRAERNIPLAAGPARPEVSTRARGVERAMTDKSGIGENVITLPQGGGAQRGIGETFSADLHTGTGNFSVPIAVPMGRNGFQPALSLSYSTGQSNGPFGLGWSLSVAGVSRKTAKGVPRYRDAATDP